jgi:mannose-6-phosphate isomerase-like protein (cupin superfamily)
MPPDRPAELRLFVHDRAPLCALDHGPLAGLRHRTVIDGASGSRELALWQEEHRPGFHVPLHAHDCEEIIAVVRGAIRAAIADEEVTVAAGGSVLIPAWVLHGFRVTGKEPVLLFAIFSSPRPRILRTDGSESTPPWRGGRSDHLDCGLPAGEPSSRSE